MARSRGKRKLGKKGTPRAGPSRSKIEALIADATVDCHDMEEAAMGFASAIDENLAVPFETEILGVTVRVEEVQETDAGRLVAVCTRERRRQRIPLEDLPLPSPPPQGHEWIAAYRHWISMA